ENSMAIVGIFIFYITLNNLLVFSLDELLQIFSDSEKVGKIRGFYLTSINLAWVLAQLFSSKVLTGSNFPLLYLISFGIMMLFFLLTFFGLKKIPDPKYDKLPAWKSIKEFIKNKNLARAYKINFLLQFFYSWMVIYTPIYLSLHLGFAWSEIATIFTIMLLPFVFLQIPAGKYSDKIGERKIMMFGFIIISLATLSLFFITRHEIWIWAVALLMTRVGAAIIEIMIDVYFFKHIKKENGEHIGIYRNASPMAYILGPLSASILFLIIPSFEFIYLVLGAIMFYGVYLSSTIKKSDV
ncbi:MFS transporter, partial [Candidatus Nomurabacteria bacterium]|nr:MFS transporter [Candidatus Nomurabacteria bacterium]